MSAGKSLPEGARLYADRHMERPEIVPLPEGEAAVFSAHPPGGEGPNEDSALLLPLGGGRTVLALADGVGGTPGGSRASVLSLRSVAERVKRAIDGGDDLRDGILDGFEQANRAVIDLALGAATTLVVAEIVGGMLRPYHVGDSAIVVSGLRGKRKLETISHSPVGYAVEAGLLDEEEALLHEERHVVSNWVGSEGMRIEVGSPIPLGLRDTILLASDGVLDNVPPERLVDTIRKGKLAKSGTSLARLCRERMSGEEGLPSKKDDYTFIAFRAARRKRAG